MATQIGTGSSITFSGFTGVVTNLTRSGMSRPAVRSSHLGTTTWDTFLPGKLTNPGTMVAEVLLDDTQITEYEAIITATAATTLTLTIPLSGDVPGTVTNATNATISASAICIDVEQTFPMEEMQGGSITFQLTGTSTSTDRADTP